MTLLTINADLQRLATAMERIEMHLAHALRIWEAAYPVKPVAEWAKPAEDLHIVGDAELLEQEDEEARHRQAEAGADSGPIDYDPYNLEYRS